jgi:hypothetical protein
MNTKVKTYGTDMDNPDDVAECRRILREYKPTPVGLAQIVSPLLARHKGNYMGAVMQAAHLLAICGSEIEESEHLSLIDQSAFNLWGVQPPRPPNGFPITFDMMLRLLMPGTGKEADRLARFRAYLKVALAAWAKAGRIADGKDDLVRAAEWIAATKERDAEAQKSFLPGAIDDSSYLYWASTFLVWQKHQRSVTGRSNVAKRKRRDK